MAKLELLGDRLKSQFAKQLVDPWPYLPNASLHPYDLLFVANEFGFRINYAACHSQTKRVT